TTWRRISSRSTPPTPSPARPNSRPRRSVSNGWRPEPIDLKIVGPTANDVERAAIDGVVTDGARRDLVLPALHAVQARTGWVSRGALNYISRRLTVPPAELWGVATFYHLLSTTPSPPTGTDTRLGAATPAERRRVVPRSVPQVGQAGLRLLGRMGRVDPTSLDAYRESEGYRALARAVSIGPPAVIEEVVASKLVGRGGAAFPTGRKWDAVAKAEARPHYLVCNADESEPGTFKDRLLMEEDPFAVVEGMTLAGYATGCERGFLYLRGEYPLAAERMAGATAAARAAGLLGGNVMGAGFTFDIEIRRGAGAYICGEETALFNSIEGKRGGPAGVFVGPADLDVALTFEGTRAIGATLGSGVVMVFGASVDLLDIVRRIAEFFRDESCGQCVPCRVGTVRQEELLARLRARRPLGSDGQELALLKDLGQVMRDASICGLGQTA